MSGTPAPLKLEREVAKAAERHRCHKTPAPLKRYRVIIYTPTCSALPVSQDTGPIEAVSSSFTLAHLLAPVSQDTGPMARDAFTRGLRRVDPFRCHETPAPLKLRLVFPGLRPVLFFPVRVSQDTGPVKQLC